MTTACEISCASRLCCVTSGDITLGRHRPADHHGWIEAWDGPGMALGCARPGFPIRFSKSAVPGGPLHHPSLQHPNRCSRPVGQLDFPEHLLQMLLHGFDADAERPGDFLVREPECDVSEDLVFPG